MVHFEGVEDLPIDAADHKGHTFFYRGDIQGELLLHYYNWSCEWNAAGDDLVANGGTLGEQNDARMRFLIEKVVQISQLSGVEDIDMSPTQTRALAGALGKWNCRENVNYGVFSPTSSPQKRPLSRDTGSAGGGAIVNVQSKKGKK
jgi:hypothetical protein